MIGGKVPENFSLLGLLTTQVNGLVEPQSFSLWLQEGFRVMLCMYSIMYDGGLDWVLEVEDAACSSCWILSFCYFGLRKKFIIIIFKGIIICYRYCNWCYCCYRSYRYRATYTVESIYYYSRSPGIRQVWKRTGNGQMECGVLYFYWVTKLFMYICIFFKSLTLKVHWINYFFVDASLCFLQYSLLRFFCSSETITVLLILLFLKYFIPIWILKVILFLIILLCDI